MKKGMLKRSIAVMITAIMLFSMTGCSKDGEGTKKKSEASQNTKEMIFAGEDFPLTGYQGDISSVYVKNDKIYFDTYEWIEEGSKNQKHISGDMAEDKEDTFDGTTENREDTPDDATKDQEDTSDEDTEDEEGYEEINGTSVSRLYSANIDGSSVTEIPLPSMEKNQWLDCLTVGSDGTIAFLLRTNDKKAEKIICELVKIDEQGKELLGTDITKELKMTQEDYVNRMLIEGRGRIIVTMNKKACILDENGKFMGEVKSNNDLKGAAVARDGTVVCGVDSEDEFCAQVRVLDVDGKKWGDTYGLELSCFPSSDSLMDGTGYDFYYKDDTGIYGYDMAGKQADKIMDYAASNITSADIWSITPIGNDKLLGKSYEETGTKLILYSKEDPSAIEDKITLTYGGVSVTSDVEEAAIEFNKTSKDYRIEIKDYSNEEDPETKMIADILAGKAPDIIDLQWLPVNQYIAKGVLEDLTPYYEKDSEIGTEDILDSVLEAMKVDNKLYYVAPSFTTDTLVARKSEVGDGTGWTINELKAWLETKDDDVKLFWPDDKAYMLYLLLGSDLSDFVDWQTGECRFDSQNFKDILEICNDRGVNEEPEHDENAPNQQTLLQEGRLLLRLGGGTAKEVELDEKMFDGDFTYIGFPNEERQGSYFWFENQIGIYSRSEGKDGAWEFIRTFMKKEYQGAMDALDMHGTPTRKDCFDMMIKRVTATEAYTDELGQKIEPLDYVLDWWGDLSDVEVKPLTDEQADMYINLVNNTKRIVDYDFAMKDIIQEEAKVYFAGEKSLDETVNLIQNRIKIYVNENR